LDHDAENLTLTAEAGMTLAEANRLMRPRRQCLPAGYPHERRTLGGLVASGRIPPKRMLYGDLRDQLLALRVATARGTLVRYGRKVIKNVAGYDMNKLFLGSEGVFGVIVETTFKLAALPDQEGGVMGAFPQRAGALACAAALYRSALLPASLVILDRRTAGVFRSAQGLADRAGAAHLFAAFDGRAIAVRRQTRDSAELMMRHGAEITDAVPMLAPAAANALEYPAANGAPGVRLDLGVPVTELAAVWEQTAAELSQLGLSATAVADYGAGRLQVACPAPETAALPRLAEAIARWRTRLAPLGGHVAVRASVPGLAVAPWGDLERELPLIRAFKAQLDPNNILVPGRFI
jgi:FAD/FMN-containing dehydrogenase